MKIPLLARFACRRYVEDEIDLPLLGLYLFIFFESRFISREKLHKLKYRFIDGIDVSEDTKDRMLNWLVHGRFIKKVKIGTRVFFKANSIEELLRQGSYSAKPRSHTTSTRSTIYTKRLVNKRKRLSLEKSPLYYKSGHIHYDEIRDFVKELRSYFPKGWDVGALPPKRRWAGIRELKNTLSKKKHNRIKDYVRYFHKKLFHGDIDNFNWAIFTDKRMIHYFKTSKKQRIADYLNSHPKEKWADAERETAKTVAKILALEKKNRKGV